MDRIFGHSKAANQARVDWMIVNEIPYEYNRAHHKPGYLYDLKKRMKAAGLYSRNTVLCDINPVPLIEAAKEGVGPGADSDSLTRMVARNYRPS